MIEVIALPLKEDSGKGHTIVEGNPAAVNAPVLETLSLTRRFGEHTAVDSLTVSVKRGEVFGFCCRQRCAPRTHVGWRGQCRWAEWW